VIQLDTSVLIDALTGPRQSLPALRHTVAGNHRLGISALALYEWRRGPRTEAELAMEAVLLGPDVVVAFGDAEAALAAEASRRVRRARGREMDLAIAACSMSYGARLWTLNPADFRDIPGLELYRP
jgi:predicted nucleic acid-binding protein